MQLKAENLKKYLRALKSKEIAIPNSPLEIFAEVSNRCNINCKMCSWYNSKKGGPLMPLVAAEKISVLFPEAHVLHAHGFGEPLLNKNIGYLLGAAKSFDVYVDFFTNGMLLTPEKSEHFVKIGVDAITLSLDGARKKTVEWIREGVRFDTIERNMKYMKAIKDSHGKTKPKMSINFIAMTCNFEEIDELIDLAKEWGIVKVEVKSLVLYDWAPLMKQYKKYYEPEKDDIILDKIKKKASDNGIEFYSFLELEPENAEEKVSAFEDNNSNQSMSSFFCWYPFRTIYIKADGNIKPCCFYWDESYLGNIFHSDLREIWNGDSYREIRRKCIDGIVPDGCQWCIINSLRPPYDDAEEFLIKMLLDHLQEAQTRATGLEDELKAIKETFGLILLEKLRRTRDILLPSGTNRRRLCDFFIKTLKNSFIKKSYSKKLL